MIFPTAFITTLFLTQIARAVPQACYYPISPELSTPDKTPEAQFHVTSPSIYTAKFNKRYDNAVGDVKGTACPELAKQYPIFLDLPFFSDIGGAFDTTTNSSHCGAIWKLNNANNKTIKTYFLSIDTSVGTSFALSATTYSALGGRPRADESGDELFINAEIVGHLGACN